MAVSMIRESGASRPLRMSSSSRSLTWSARTRRASGRSPVIGRSRRRARSRRSGSAVPARARTSTRPAAAVDPDRVAGRDAVRRVGRPDDGGDAELPGEDRRMRRRPAGVGHEPGDLGEQHDPRRVRHLADEDVPVADLVELVDRADDARRPLDHPRRRRDALDDRRLGRGRAMEPLRVAPVDEVRERELRSASRSRPSRAA